MKAIVYTSNAGHAARYAKILGNKTGLPVYELGEAAQKLAKGAPILFVGWLFANTVKDYKKAAKAFRICAVCAVGLCDTGTAIDAVRKANAMADTLPLFTLQGGMNKQALQKPYQFAIRILIKAMESKKLKTDDDLRMIYLLKNDRDYVCEENTAAFMQWYRENRAD